MRLTSEELEEWRRLVRKMYLTPGEADWQMNQVPYDTVRVLHGLPRAEQLGDCSMCREDRLKLVQLGVVGHQVALCGSCLRVIAKHLVLVGRVTP